MFVANNILAANKIGDVEGNDKLIEKSKKLLKSRKLSNDQKSAKSRKKLSKIGNLPNFNAKENGPSFSIPKAKTTFNCLQLAFTKALILCHFDPKCHI